MKAKSIEDRIPAYIRGIVAYRAGKPVEEVERELRIIAVKLASNENPLGPSPLAVAAAAKSLAASNWYPDGSGYYLRQKLSARLNLEMDSLMLGCGSCELIDVVARTLLEHGDEAVTSEGSFPLYYTAVRATGERLVVVPMRDDAFDLDAIAGAITPRTKLVYLSNPNNPTGTVFTADDLDKFLARVPESVLVVLDEAYYEYADRPGYSRSSDLVRAGRNLLFLRTFSKVYGLAGLRIGYAAGPPDLIAQMNKVRQPFNVSNVAQAAAFAALDDVEHVRRSLENNRRGLAQLEAGLAEQGVAFVPSVANFVLVRLGAGAKALAEEMLHLGVIVRPMGWMGFPEAIRVSVGRPDENEKFLAALAEARAKVDHRRPEALRPASTQG
jgi:histidinol-phosphate aminotransferase